jgi:peroxiredoxin
MKKARILYLLLIGVLAMWACGTYRPISSAQKTTDVIKNLQNKMDNISSLQFDAIYGVDRSDNENYRDTFLMAGHVWQKNVPSDTAYQAHFDIWADNLSGKITTDSIWSRSFYDGIKVTTVNTPEKKIWVDDPQVNGFGRIDVRKYNPLYSSFFTNMALSGWLNKSLTASAAHNQLDTLLFRYGSPWHRHWGWELVSITPEHDTIRQQYYLDDNGFPWKEEQYFSMTFRGQLEKTHLFTERRNIILNPNYVIDPKVPNWPVEYNRNTAKALKIVSLDGRDTIKYVPNEKSSRPVILNFYSFGCPATEQVMKMLNDQSEELNKNFDVYCLSMDSPTAAVRFIKEYDLKLPVYRNNVEGIKKYEVPNMETLFVIKGKDILLRTGYLTPEMMEEILKIGRTAGTEK